MSLTLVFDAARLMVKFESIPIGMAVHRLLEPDLQKRVGYIQDIECESTVLERLRAIGMQ